MPLDSSEPRKTPDPVAIPEDRAKLLKFALDQIERCRATAGIRAAYYRQLFIASETGREDGTRSLANLLYAYLDKLAPHLFSPTELKFTVDFENIYPKNIEERGQRVAKLLTRDWERNNTDMKFSRGVFESLRYGATFLKQWVQEEGPEKVPVSYSSLVMPWQMGVDREDLNELDRQSVICETIPLSMPEVWRRIWFMPDAETLYRRIKTHAGANNDDGAISSMFHQVLSTSVLNTSNTTNSRPTPGGIVQLNNAPNYSIMGPESSTDLVKMHELWVWNGSQRATIQIIEPDIILAPRSWLKLSNLLISGEAGSDIHPYTLIQPNESTNYLWGRSELVDLMRTQEWLSLSVDDLQRMFGVQIDKILAFSGFDGITAENYDQMRAAGFFNGPPGASVSDLTPKLPPEAMPIIKLIIELMDRIAGFDGLLSGRGEPGVRAGVHADTLLKTASPRLRDRSLLVERQCASAADTRLSIMEAKDDRHYWTHGATEQEIEATRFTLKDLPEDRRVSVDSHSGSPIFADDHANLIGQGVKLGFVDGESAIELLPFPQKDILIQRYRDKQAQQAAQLKMLMEKDPEAWVKLMEHQGRKH